MKKIIKITLLLLCTGLFISLTSCAVLVPAPKKDNGKHKGWYKNSNNPHNPRHENHQDDQNKSKGKFDKKHKD
jgi:hypothetical protein